MALVDLVMPKMGESIMEATILKWRKHPGESVKQDETLLEIATDKVDTEVPSTTAGILEELLHAENDVVPVGTVIARIRTQVEEIPKTPASPVPSEPASRPAQEERVASAGVLSGATTATALKAPKTNGSSNRFYSPLVLNIAANEGVSLTELETLYGTGNEGRVTKKDILQYVQSKQGQTQSETRYSTQPEPYGSDTQRRPSPVEAEPSYGTASGNTEILEMDRMRRLIAEHMVRSKHTSAHVTSFSEADVTNLVLWREKVKKEFEKREGTKITLTPIFIEAVVRCIKKYPLVNSSVDGNRIIIKKDINLGMATALPNGNLIVPVIRNADQFSLVGLSKQVNQLAETARNNKLRPEDTQGGTFTLTNVGIFGSLMGTPIINQPQVAILAVGVIKKRPVVIETEMGDSIAIRHMMYLSLSYDHRIVDGSLGASFLSAVAKDLENFRPDREF